MKIVVTGATGYIGERFIRLALASGHEVVAFCRQPPETVGCDWVSYNLSTSQVPVLPVEADVVFHLATSKFSDGEQDSKQDILAAELLITATQSVGARLFFMSSQTARPDAPTTYGRTKWNIERLILAAGGCVIRPGQVYGGRSRGLFGELLSTIRRMPVLPAFLPAPRIQPIHVDDLTLGLLRMAERVKTPSHVLCLAAPEPVTFTAFLRTIAHVRLRLRRFFLPVPTLFVSAAIRLVGKQTGLERLNSLFDLPVMDSAPDLQLLELQLRPLYSGMHKAGNIRRRKLLIEGYALLSYVLTVPPTMELLRRYVRSVEMLRGGRVLHLPRLFEWWPALLALIDDECSGGTIWGEEFMWRLDGATILAEATPQGARQFLGLGDHHGSVRSLFGMAYAVLSEVWWRILSMLLAPVARIVLSRSLECRL
ncbi:NAD-dependent epimerase/dehydratase family protein [Mariprofundus ferrooxydans]|uniref:NAD-dependent epimerase/dehydratase family protein n=1 Tax=Mariprofundus ferrooxydans TaxID=314344 RepID=UPI00037B3C85|nr:NAD-dependent epimerase/dehydratase family protein [Mariprofundus ferrooxydans]